MQDEIKARIGELREQLESTADSDADELKQAVAAFGDDGDHEALLDRLSESARRFEASHPELSAVVAKVIDSLTAAGI